MPTYVRPARVIVEESGGGLAAAVAVIGLGAVISSAAVIIADVLTAVLIIMCALALAGLGVLAIVLRRHGLRAPLPPGPGRTPAHPPTARTAQAITGPPLAIGAPRPGARTYPTETQIRNSTSEFIHWTDWTSPEG